MIKSPHPALDLSFMCLRKVGGGVAYWNVETTGSYSTDFERGRQFGDEFMKYIAKYPTNGNVTLLGCIVVDMADHPAKALKLGFMGVIAEYAMALAAALAKMNTDTPTASSPVHDAIVRYRAADAEFRELVDAHDDFPDDAPEWAAKESLEDAMIATPCVTLDDVRAKARLALEDANVFDSLTNCRIDSVHVQTIFLRSLLGETS